MGGRDVCEVRGTISTSEAPTRVAYVIDTLLEPTGGGESQLVALLQRLDRSRFVPHLFCLRSSEWLRSQPSDFGWTDLEATVSPRPTFPGHVRRLSVALREGGFDIVQTHFRDANLLGVLAAWHARTPCVISTRRGVPYWKSYPGLLLLRQLNRIPTWFIANSRATRDRYVEKEHIDPSRIEVIYNGLDRSRFSALTSLERSSLLRELGLPAATPLVGLVGNLRPVKGIDTFVRAAREVAGRHPRAHFVIVGRGPDEAPLRELAHDLGISDQVHLVGVRRDVPRVLQLLNVAVLASRFESFSNSILEYLAAGVPSVVTDVGGAREVILPGRNGYIVPPDAPRAMAARIADLLDEPDGTRAWVQGPGLDERFTMERMVRSHQEVYERQLDWAIAAGRQLNRS